MRTTFLMLLAACLAMPIYGQTTLTSPNKATKEKKMTTIYDFSLTDAQGNDVSLSEYKGKVLLVVNTATKCGFTPQYEKLEEMYRDMRAEGFEIIDIPCNQFRDQAPGSNEEITQFCRMNFGTEFPQFKRSWARGRRKIRLGSLDKRVLGMRLKVSAWK